MIELPDVERTVTRSNDQLIATDERFAIRVTKTFKGELPVKDVTVTIEMFHAIEDNEETVFVPIDEHNPSVDRLVTSYETSDTLEK